MDATLILIDSDADLVRARALVDRLLQSDDPADVARLEAQVLLIAAYEKSKWPRRPPSTDLIRHVMDQHGAVAPSLADLLLAMPQDDGEFSARKVQMRDLKP